MAYAARRAFSMAETIVTLCVIAVAAILFLPQVMAARQRSAQFLTMGNIREVAVGITSMATEDRLYPPSYVYGADRTSIDWRIEDQRGAHPIPANGYVHFSAVLLERGFVTGEDAFTSPVAPRGGAPRTNPGPDLGDWEIRQINDLGQSAGAPIPSDRQAVRMAFTANHAILPRNKFSTPTVRRNEQVSHPGDAVATPGPHTLTRAWQIEDPRRTCLLTEFHYSATAGWRSIASGRVSKSHRPITPFQGRSAGPDVFSEPDRSDMPRFEYPRESDIAADGDIGSSAIEDPRTSINAMGRLQPGGRAHMAMIDGSVLLKRPVESVAERLWGERFYAITGFDEVLQP